MQLSAKSCAFYSQVSVLVAASGLPTNQPNEEEVRLLAILRFLLFELF
jgi:hypothetical protein